MAFLTMVIAAFEVNLADEAGERLGPIADEAGRFAAVRAGHARTDVVLFFRSVRADSMAHAPIVCERSRTSNSVLPKKSGSALETRIRALASDFVLDFLADDGGDALGFGFLFGCELRSGHGSLLTVGGRFSWRVPTPPSA